MSNKEWKKRSKRKLKIKKDFGLRCLVDKSGISIKVRSKTREILTALFVFSTMLMLRKSYSFTFNITAAELYGKLMFNRSFRMAQ